MKGVALSPHSFRARLPFLAAFTCAAALLAGPSCDSGPPAGQGGGQSTATENGGTGASGGDDLPSGGAWQQPPTCDGGPGGGGGGGALTTSSSGGGGAGGAGPTSGCEGVVGQAHFAKDVGPILAGCTGELCHLPPGYSDLVLVPATECCDGRLLVAPFDPAHSYLVDKLRGDNLCYGGAMPFGTASLDDADIQSIVRWICGGAPFD